MNLTEFIEKWGKTLVEGPLSTRPHTDDPPELASLPLHRRQHLSILFGRPLATKRDFDLAQHAMKGGLVLNNSSQKGVVAVRLSPNDTRLRVTVGMAYQQAGRHPEAETHYVAATQLNPNGPEGYVALAQLYLMQNRGAELNEIMQRLQQINPQAAQMLQTQMQMQQAQQWQQTGQRWVQNAQEQWRAFMQNFAPAAPTQNPPGQPPPSPNQWNRPR